MYAKCGKSHSTLEIDFIGHYGHYWEFLELFLDFSRIWSVLTFFEGFGQVFGIFEQFQDFNPNMSYFIDRFQVFWTTFDQFWTLQQPYFRQFSPITYLNCLPCIFFVIISVYLLFYCHMSHPFGISQLLEQFTYHRAFCYLFMIYSYYYPPPYFHVRTRKSCVFSPVAYK